MESKVERITPDLARIYLDKMGENRTVSPPKVNAYADDMRSGNWFLNGEGIKFNDLGVLVDGQHRLLAIIRANKSVEMVVVRGIDSSVELFDKGRPRTTSDTLRIGGMEKELSSNSLVAIVKFHFRYQYNNNLPSDMTVKKYIMSHEENLRKLVSLMRIGSKKNAPNMGAPLYCALYYALELGMPYERCERFMSILATGFYDDQKERAAIVLRNDLANKNLVSNHGNERLSLFYSTQKAFDDFIRGYARVKSYKNISVATYSDDIRLK